MKYNTTIYKHTGFNASNIPDSPAAVIAAAGNNFLNLQDSILRQDSGIAYLKVQARWEDIEDADYCKVGNIYYFVTDIKMINDNVAALQLAEDSLTTLGGVKNITFIDGLVTRRSEPSDAEIFSNNLPENFANRFQLVCETYKLDEEVEQKINYTDTMKIITSTIDLTQVSDLADVYVGDATTGDYNVVVPSIPSPVPEENATTFTLGSDTITPPGVCSFDFENENIQAAIKKIRALGLENVLVGCYAVPKSFLNARKDTTGKIINILSVPHSKLHMYDINSKKLAVVYGIADYIPKNKKCYSILNTVTLYSPISGDTKTFYAYDLDRECAFDLFADCTSGGRTYCRPHVINGEETNELNKFNNAVQGGNWTSAPVVLEGQSGSELASSLMALKRQNMNYEWNKAVEGGVTGYAFKSASGKISSTSSNMYGYGEDKLGVREGITGISSVFGGLINDASNMAGLFDQPDYQEYLGNAARKIMTERLQYEASSKLAPPQMMFTQGTELQLYLGNTFYCIHTHLDVEDLKRLDNYFTAFGVASNEIVEPDVFVSHTNFDYVEIIGATIQDNQTNKLFTRRRVERAQQQLQYGARIWHVKPDRALLTNNPIKTS